MHKLKSDYITLTPNNRLYGLKKPIIGLTGGIASGKSTAAVYLKNKRIPLLDADALVKEVYKEKETIKFIYNNYPSAVTNNSINFKKLREIVFNSSEDKRKITHFIYQKLPNTFMYEYNKLDFSEYDFCLYDVPLLFENQMENLFDMTTLVYSPRDTQEKRLIKRDLISKELATKILDQQMPIEDKRQKSNFIISNLGDLQDLNNEIELFLDQIVL